MKKYGFYHIYCVNDWKDIFENQINKLITSKVLDFIDKMYITINYILDQDLVYIKEKIKNLNVEIVYFSKENKYEFPALEKIKEICKIEDCYVFYFHTKGSSINEKNKTFYHNSSDLKHLKNCVNDWREYMEYFIIENYNKCLDVLSENDACGVNLVSEPSNHFSGNFWWSKSSYINKLHEFSLVNQNHRWNAEFWIGSGNGKLYSFMNNGAGYKKRINREEYIFKNENN